jgi:hypothetical protein
VNEEEPLLLTFEFREREREREREKVRKYREEENCGTAFACATERSKISSDNNQQN